MSASSLKETLIPHPILCGVSISVLELEAGEDVCGGTVDYIKVIIELLD